MTEEPENIDQAQGDMLPDDILEEINAPFDEDAQNDGSVESILTDTQEGADDYSDQIQALTDRLGELEGRLGLPETLLSVFPASTGTGSTITELLPINGTLGIFTGSPRINMPALALSSNQCLALEILDADGVNLRYIPIVGGSASGNSGVVSITGTLTTGGVYTCFPATPLTTIIFSGTSFGAATIVTAATSGAGIYCNLIEMGKSTHDLVSTTNTATVASYVATGLNGTTGTTVYIGPHLFPGCDAT